MGVIDNKEAQYCAFAHNIETLLNFIFDLFEYQLKQMRLRLKKGKTLIDSSKRTDVYKKHFKFLMTRMKTKTSK